VASNLVGPIPSRGSNIDLSRAAIASIGIKDYLPEIMQFLITAWNKIGFLTMNKPKKTTKELAEMITAHIGIGGVAVVIHKDDIYGWHPVVIASPVQADSLQAFAENAARELRSQYDLAN
jgi:hypothetical protein